MSSFIFWLSTQKVSKTLEERQSVTKTDTLQFLCDSDTESLTHNKVNKLF